MNGIPTSEDLRRYHEVVNAAERAWFGESSIDIRARLVQELESRGLPLPPDFVLDIEADRIASGRGRAGRARGIFHQLRLMAGGVAEIRKLFLNATPLPHPPGRGTYLVEKAPPAEVLLHPGARDLLGSPPDTQATGLVGVWLVDAEEGIAVNTEGGQVGMLRDEDVAAYLPIIRLANEKGAVAVMPAVLSMESGGTLRLRLGISTR